MDEGHIWVVYIHDMQRPGLSQGVSSVLDGEDELHSVQLAVDRGQRHASVHPGLHICLSVLWAGIPQHSYRQFFGQNPAKEVVFEGPKNKTSSYIGLI